MPILVQHVEGLLVRIGAEKYKDPYTASVVVTYDGVVMGFAGKASLTQQRQALRQVSMILGKPLTWERYKKWQIEGRRPRPLEVISYLMQKFKWLIMMRILNV